MDGEFNSSDFVDVISAGQYEDDVASNSKWGTGDWYDDGEFTSDDLVFALADGGYAAGPRPAAVPEPRGAAMVLIGLFSFFIVSRRVA